MKKLVTAVCLLGLLSVPSAVFADCEPGEMSEDATAEEMMAAKEAAMNSDECTRSRVSALESGAVWYGSLRAGIKSSGTAGVSNFSSRFGIKGSSEVAEGLTAVYYFEHGIDSTNANLGAAGGRESYVGLSGGFGTLTFGKVYSASYNSVGAITDNSFQLGDSETPYQHGNVVSYAVSVENISLQVDAVMNNGGGTTGDKENMKAEDKNVDAFELGVSMGLGESGKIAFAHRSLDAGTWVETDESYTGPDPDNKVTVKANYIAGEYSIGGMTAYLGFAQLKGEDKTEAITGKQTNKTTFAGIRGSIADTGVSYLFQARSKKTKGNTGGERDDQDMPLDANKHTPWTIGLNRTLGGGASVHFAHANPDQKGEKSTSVLALKVDF